MSVTCPLPSLDEPSGKAERERLTGIGKGVIHRMWGAGH